MADAVRTTAPSPRPWVPAALEERIQADAVRYGARDADALDAPAALRREVVELRAPFQTVRFVRA